MLPSGHSTGEPKNGDRGMEKNYCLGSAEDLSLDTPPILIEKKIGGAQHPSLDQSMHGVPSSLRTQTYFRLSLVSAENNVCEPEPGNDFCDVMTFVAFSLANQVS